MNREAVFKVLISSNLCQKLLHQVPVDLPTWSLPRLQLRDWSGERLDPTVVVHLDVCWIDAGIVSTGHEDIKSVDTESFPVEALSETSVCLQLDAKTEELIG